MSKYKILKITSCQECHYKYHSREEGWLCGHPKLNKNNESDRSLGWDIWDNTRSDTVKTFLKLCPLEDKK